MEIRELSERTGTWRIQIEESGVFDMLLAMWASAADPEKSNVDLSNRQELYDAIPPELAKEIEELGGPGNTVWLALAALFLTGPPPHTPATLIEWLSAMSPGRLRRWLLEHYLSDESPGVIELAAEGDLKALEERLSAEKGAKLKPLFDLLEIEGDGLPSRLGSALARFRTDAYGIVESEVSLLITQAAALAADQSVDAEAASIIEDLTNGLDYEIPRGVRRIALVPVLTTHPLSLIEEHRDMLAVYYPVPDDLMGSKPGFPPASLVRSFTGRGDARRLRILRLLAEGDSSLDELAATLKVSKSTVHHHVSQLRAAGMVRVSVPAGGDKRYHYLYRLRRQGITTLGEALSAYLDEREPNDV